MKRALFSATHKTTEVLTASLNLLIIGMREDLRCGRAKMTLMLANDAAMQSKLHYREFKPARVSVTSVTDDTCHRHQMIHLYPIQVYMYTVPA